jgi:hypothetical protein
MRLETTGYPEHAIRSWHYAGAVAVLAIIAVTPWVLP